MAAARVKIRPAAASVQDHFAELVARHRGLVEQRDLALAAPAAMSEVAAKIGAAIELLAARAHAWNFVRGAVNHENTPAHLADDLRLAVSTPPGAMQRPTAADLLAAIAPRAMQEWLTGQLEEVYRDLPAPMDAKARTAKVAELEREIAAVEREAAEVWWQAIDTGLQISPPDILTAAAALGLEP